MKIHIHVARPATSLVLSSGSSFLSSSQISSDEHEMVARNAYMLVYLSIVIVWVLLYELSLCDNTYVSFSGPLMYTKQVQFEMYRHLMSWGFPFVYKLVYLWGADICWKQVQLLSLVQDVCM